MELALLRRSVDELRPRLIGSRTDRIYAVPRYDIVVAPGSGGHQLWFSVEPEDPHLCVRRARPRTDRTPPGFAMAARKWGRGRRVADVGLIRGDRVVRLAWEGGGSLIAELVPRRATAFVVDDAGRVVAVWNPRRGRPGIGDPYTAPARPAKPRDDELEPARWAALSALDTGGLRRDLVRGVAGVTPMLADEILHRWRRGDNDLPGTVRAVLEDAEAGPAVLYSPVPLDDPSASVEAEDLLLAPCPLQERRDEPKRTFESAAEACTNYYKLRARLRLRLRARTAVTTAIDRRLQRLARRAAQTPGESDVTARCAELRRHADLLLAAPRARLDGPIARVPDVYGDGSEVGIPVDPSLDLAANAARLYRRARRLEGETTRQAAAARAAAAEREALQDLRIRAAAMPDGKSVQEVLGHARQLGLRIPQERLRSAEAGTGHFEGNPRATDTQMSGILRVRGASGHEILVGRSAAANDRLSHQVAAPHDWWLHAVGPGSHVVLRNPRRLPQPPPDALAEAAALAAWFSKARSAAKVEVHWTQARRVRKPRRAPAGSAQMEEFRTFVVAPRPPAQVSAASD